MNHYIAAVLLLQYFPESLQSNTTNPGNTTNLTWREIVPNYCGYRNDELENLLENIHRGRRSVDGDDDKVMNGHISTIDAHPWQVAVLISRDNFSICGGSIISKYHVLSAAHCFMHQTNETINNITYKSATPVSLTERLVAVGSSRYNESELVYPIKQFFIHNFYSFSHRRNDLALLKIDGEFVWTRVVHPICLPSEDEPYTPGRDCGISGFGNVAFRSPNFVGIIRSASVQLSTADDCTKEYNKFERIIFGGMVCASGNLGEDAYIDACQGDSGGPLQCKKKSGTQRVLLGVTSFGMRCGVEDYPGVYTRVTKYLPWIRNRMELSLRDGYGLKSNLPEDEDVGRPTHVASAV